VTLAVSLLYFALFLGYTHVNYSHIVLDDPFQSGSEVKSIVADLGVPLIDLRETFREHADPFSLFPLRLPATTTSPDTCWSPKQF
jgi:hypothetical protein